MLKYCYLDNAWSFMYTILHESVVIQGHSFYHRYKNLVVLISTYVLYNG